MGKLTLAVAVAALGLASAAQAATAVVGAPVPVGPSAEKVRMNVSQVSLAAGERMPDQAPPAYLRYIYVVSGQVQVSNLVTGDTQNLAAGEMAVETAGEMHSAKAFDGPAQLMLVEQPQAN
jgi:quercetin dioxygenase-like cupin family protein